MLSLRKMFVISIATIGCSGCATLELLAASGLSYVVTGKSLTDNVVSVAVDKDCAMLRVLQNQDMCLDMPSSSDGDEQTLIAEVAEVSGDDNVKEDVVSQNTLSAKLYAVVGSFNNHQFAVERMHKYQAYDAQIIEVDNGNVAYRVVVGPLSSEQELAELPHRVGAELADPWVINLCETGMAVGSCEHDLLAKR